MKTFVNSMNVAGVSPFVEDSQYKGDPQYSTSVSNDSIKEIISIIPEMLLEVLKNFKGLEAFYMVSVQHGVENESVSDQDEEKDTRKAEGIEMWEIPEGEHFEGSNVNCFFTFRSTEEKQ